MLTMATIEEERLQGIAQILVQENLISKEKAFVYQKDALLAKISLLQYLVTNDILTSNKIGVAVSNNFGLPLIDLNSIDLDSLPISLVSEKLIRRHNIIPLFNRGKQLYLAIDDPTKQASLKEIQFHTGLYTNPLIVETDKLYELIERLLNTKDAQGLSDYFEESSDLDGIEFSVGWDRSYNDYSIVFPELQIGEEASEKGIYDQSIVGITTKPEVAKRVFEYASKLAGTESDVYKIYKRVEAFCRDLPYE